jgi:hypothetical protein
VFRFDDGHFWSVRLNSRVEIVSFQPWPDRTGYFKVQVAVAGRLAWPFDVYEGDWKQMTEHEQAAYLERSAMALLSRYGDAREIRVREDGQIVPRYGEAEAGI